MFTIVVKSCADCPYNKTCDVLNMLDIAQQQAVKRNQQIMIDCPFMPKEYMNAYVEVPRNDAGDMLSQSVEDIQGRLVKYNHSEGWWQDENGSPVHVERWKYLDPLQL